MSLHVHVILQVHLPMHSNDVYDSYLFPLTVCPEGLSQHHVLPELWLGSLASSPRDLPSPSIPSAGWGGGYKSLQTHAAFYVGFELRASFLCS